MYEFLFTFSEKVSAADIVRVARRMLASGPAVAARGKLAHLPSFEEIQATMTPGTEVSGIGRRLNLFRNW